MDRLIRSAAAAATGVDPKRVPWSTPRRVPAGRSGHYASALPIRLSGTARESGTAVAERTAVLLRASPHVVDAAVEGVGFVNITLTPAARAALVPAAAADGFGYLTATTAWADSGSAGSTGSAGNTASAANTGTPVSAANAAETDSDLWRCSPLEEAGSAARAAEWAREDARTRVNLAAGPPGAREPAALRAADPGTGWRDPLYGAAGAVTPAARLLAVVGTAAARVAFCRADGGREESGPGLPALPTAEAPGHWASLTAANPAFALRYAHAHASASRQWARDAGEFHPLPPGALTAPAVADLDGPTAAALVGVLFDGPGALASAARRGEPHILVRYLETLASAYHDWRETCGLGSGELGDRYPAAADRREATAARLGLCAATAGVLRTGLFLIGVSAPTRL
ncbi:DALR anticodon-binding domain-containing protein [Murinocardiopsis flavida]|uniref:DALR anticodon-binding domain-containing protein n=1 Tax=Murinocardiopsis flavida TaxID=645275 RepID=UPI001FEAB2A7|nr:DALR anticodon-binding domain-containing protein [Murinocardiopsis flavida]